MKYIRHLIYLRLAEACSKRYDYYGEAHYEYKAKQVLR